MAIHTHHPKRTKDCVFCKFWMSCGKKGRKEFAAHSNQEMIYYRELAEKWYHKSC